MMIVSGNEIEMTLRKAALGGGWPMGLAEEAGRAAAWLAARGFDGVGAAVAALEPGPVVAEAKQTRDGWEFPATRVAAAGPSAFDLLAAGSAGEQVIMRRLDQPMLAIGLAGVASVAYGGGFDLVFPMGGSAKVTADGVLLTGPVPETGIDISVTRNTAELEAPPALAIMGIEVDDQLWGRAQAMAAWTYVPASEASRAHGAGAGLTDND